MAGASRRQLVAGNGGGGDESRKLRRSSLIVLCDVRLPQRIRSVKVFIALSFLAASVMAASAQYVMQPSLGGAYNYGPEPKLETVQPVKPTPKRTAHRRAMRPDQKATRPPVSR